MQTSQVTLWFKTGLKTMVFKILCCSITFGLQAVQDYSLFTKKTSGSFIALLVYVDDILIASDNQQSVAELKIMLDQQFKLKDLCDLKFFLGLEIARSEKGIHLCQRKFILELLSDAGLLGCKLEKTPMEHNLKLSKFQGELLENPSSY